MTIRELKDLLDAELVWGQELLDTEVGNACGADLMSDVLAFDLGHGALITGLISPQVIRTAEMMDIKCVVLARGKKASEQMTELAKQSGIAFMCTKLAMFTCCGRLYAAGVKGGE